LKTKPKIVVVTGAESTGKSTLAESLSSYFNAPVIPEFAREYVEKLDRRYNYHDVEVIAQKQVDQLKSFLKKEHQVIFVDTWLIITKVWFEVVFQQVPEWLENEIRSLKIDLFLVCNIDLPWIPDLVRENGGENRRILQNMYIENIKKYNFTFHMVNGEEQSRFENALEPVKLLMKK